MKILGVNRRGHPSENSPNSYVEYRVVLWDAGDESYRDIRASIGEGSDEWVARQGDPISLSEAEIHFPFIRAQIPDVETAFRI